MALRPVSRIDDYHFPPGLWDMRGWTVHTTLDQEKVGKVDDMLVDGTGALRFLDIDLGFLKKHVLVPLGHTYADREEERVWIEHMTRERIEDAPEYALEPEILDEGYERRLEAVYADSGTVLPGADGDPGALPDRSAPLTAASDGPVDLPLKRLSTIDDEYKVAGDDPRNWEVVTGDGRSVGRVKDLLVEPGEMKARFLDVAVDEAELELEPVDRHILLPTERVRLDRRKDRVVVGGLLAGDLARYPQYGGLPVRHDQALELDRFFDHTGHTGPLTSVDHHD